MRINHQIRSEKLIVIDETGKSLGVLSLGEALKAAQARGLDLIEVNPAANPPVAKILDYGKFEYHQRKAERKIKAAHKKQELKTIKVGLKTSAHDVEVKAGQASKFLQKGDKVRLEIFLRGREKAHRDLAREKLRGFEKQVTEPHKIEGSAVSTPSGWSVIIYK
ncbi:MAG: translation initiation factor IF-3 [Patescibacteria group bacterium]